MFTLYFLLSATGRFEAVSAKSFIMVSILSFFAPEEKCNGSGAGVASNGGSNIIYHNISVKIFKAFFDKFCNFICVIEASRLADIAFSGIGKAAFGVFFHSFYNFLNNFFLGTDLCPCDKVPFLINVKERADSKNRSYGAGSF